MDLFRFVPDYTRVVYDEGKEPLFFLFLAFLAAFALTRSYTRLARRHGWGSGSVGGVHLHHVVPGLVLVLVSGLLVYTRVGASEIVHELCAIAFGAGAALVLDEFALVFYLRDVYWAKEGRASVDAAILGLMTAGLCLVASEPFAFDDPGRRLGRLVFFAVVAADLLFAAVTFLKGKHFAGTAAIFLPPVGWLGAARLATPGSPWARWFYSSGPGPDRVRERRARKLERARRRERSGFAAEFRRRLVRFVGGGP